MPLFDFTDPDNSAMLGMIQAAGQAATPSPVKMPLGSVLGQIAGGALTGAKAGQQYQSGQLAIQQQQLQNQLTGFQVKNLQNYYNLLSGKLGQQANPPQQPDPSAEPAKQFGLPDTLHGMDKSSGLPNAMNPSNLSKFDLQPQDYIELGRVLSMVPGASNAGAEMIKLGTANYLPSVGGGQSYVPGGATDPQVQLRTALMQKLGSNGQMIGQDGTVQNAPGLVQSSAELAGGVKGAEAAAQSPYDLKKVQTEQNLITQREMELEKQKQAATPVSMQTPWGNFTGNALQFKNFLASPTADQTTPAQGEVPLTSGAVVPAQPEGKKGFGVPTLDNNQVTMVQNWHNALQDAYEAKSRLTQLSNIYQRVESGGLKTESAEIMQDLHSLGIDIPPEKMQNSGDIQTAIHQNWVTSVKAIKSSLGGGGTRLGQQEILLNAENSFSPDFAPQANHAAITQTLGEINSFVNLVQGWDKTAKDPNGWTNPNQYSSAFYERNPIDGFVKAAKESIPPFKGMPGWKAQNSAVLSTPPDPASRVEGQTYNTPKGPMQWTKQGWLPVSGAVNAQ